MKKITFNEALKHTSPQPVSLISSLTPEGITNLAAVCWWTYLESEPPMIGFSMGNNSYTRKLIVKNRKAVLSIPGEAIAEEAFQCGTVSGRDVNKAEKYKIELTGDLLKYPVHSKLAFICSLKSTAAVGDCTFFICRIDDIFFRENERQLFAWGGSEKLSPIA
jgi:flavin reductase (DIM6/NTAB) family NADH-FMN oxidoreductase RutF